MDEIKSGKFYCSSHNVPHIMRNCENCILNDKIGVVCSLDYRRVQQTEKADQPCPRWDGGLAVEVK